jgi:hypothetical protein
MSTDAVFSPYEEFNYNAFLGGLDNDDLTSGTDDDDFAAGSDNNDDKELLLLVADNEPANNLCLSAIRILLHHHHSSTRHQMTPHALQLEDNMIPALCRNSLVEHQ